MSDAPERIWATHDLRNGYYFTASGPQLRFEDVEYVRADRIEELEAKLAKALEGLRYYAQEGDDGGWLANGILAELTSSVAANGEAKGGKDE